MGIELSRKEYKDILELAVVLLKDNLEHHRYKKEDYIQMKQMLEKFQSRRMKIEGIEDDEQGSQATMDSYIGRRERD